MFTSQSIGIFGFGISGQSAFKHLLRDNSRIVVYDEKIQHQHLSQDIQESLKSHSIPILHPSYIDTSIDILIVSPGIPRNNQYLQQARKLAISIYTDIDIAMQSKPNDLQTIAITGTNGKSTITSWVSYCLNIQASGNIGTPILDTIAKNQSYQAIELSSFQLEHSNPYSYDIAVINNIEPDHILWHGSYSAYQEAKLKITKLQTSKQWLILGQEKLLSIVETKANILLIDPTNTSQYHNRIFIEETNIVIEINGTKQVLCPLSHIKLPGSHNIHNGLCVLAMLHLLKVDISDKFTSFTGLEHRLETVKSINHITYINDSKSTNPICSMHAIQAFPSHKIGLFLGGRTKSTPWDDLIKTINTNHITLVMLFGESKEYLHSIMSNKLNPQTTIQVINSLQEGLEHIPDYNLNTVLFSPGCTSFDEYKNFEERGNYFKELVNKL